jgi:hypothetical protein
MIMHHAIAHPNGPVCHSLLNVARHVFYVLVNAAQTRIMLMETANVVTCPHNGLT